jgi:hypothetical protein
VETKSDGRPLVGIKKKGICFFFHSGMVYCGSENENKLLFFASVFFESLFYPLLEGSIPTN